MNDDSKPPKDSAKDRDGGAEVVPLTRGVCPLCGKPAKPETRPFCSRRCADRDLGNWLNESYYVPGDEIVNPEQAEEFGRDDEA